MTRFIFLSMAFLILSFLIVPAYFGIKNEHDMLTQAGIGIETQSELTFEEIYALADEALLNDPSALNAIEPAAGEDKKDEGFSYGFSGISDSALTDEEIKDTTL